MIQTYQGYFQEDGRFVPDGVLVKLPIRRRAIVNVFDEEVVCEGETSKSDTALQDRIERIRLIITAALEAEDDVMTDNDWEEMLALRAQTNAGLSRAVDL